MTSQKWPPPDISIILEESVQNVPQFAGGLWYVNLANGNDANSGDVPSKAFQTIGAALTAMADGDAVIIAAGVYTEVGLDLANDSSELWFEIGAILRPATGTGLLISGNSCRVICREGALLIDPVAANTTGVEVTGTSAYLAEIKCKMDSIGDIGFDLQGDGADLRRCRCSNPLIAAFKVQADRIKLENCCTGGEVGDSSIGFWVTSSCDKARIKNCGSQGHETAGYQVDAGCTNGVVENSYSGGGDGPRIDVDAVFVWSKYSFDDYVYKGITLNNTHAYSLFKVTGSIEIEEIFGHVETALVGANTSCYWQLYSSAGVDVITKVTDGDLGAAPVGTIVIKTEDPGKELTVLTAATPSVDKTADPKKRGVFLTADADQDTYVRWICAGNNDTEGYLHFHVKWRPLTDGSFLEAV